MKQRDRKIVLDDLLDRTEPFGTFHDAYLHKLNINYDTRELIAEFDICVGNPDGETKEERERYRRGVLRVSGLIFWALEAPEDKDTNKWGPLWLTSDGLLEEGPTDTAKRLSSTLKPGVYGWYLYFSNINAFGYLSADEATFEWKTAT
jgi:hypothetical protein